MQFPIFNSKNLSDGQVYNLFDSFERKKYFNAKLGTRVEKLKEYLDKNTFVGYMIGKKQAGKGTYAKMVEEILGKERFAHISVGDVIRDAHEALNDPERSKFLYSQVARHYRGFISLEEAFNSIHNRSQSEVSVSDELVLALLKTKIDSMGRKALFIDGLPRTDDQISYTLYFRDLINYRDDTDFFILIDVPREVIKARMSGRLVCPLCKTSKNIHFNPTKFVEYDKASGEYLIKCDNPSCSGFGNTVCVEKEGDAEGIESIAERIKIDEELIGKAFDIYGIPKVLVAGSVPLNKAAEYLEKYEIQTKFSYKFDGTKVSVVEEAFSFVSDNGEESYIPFAAVYVVNIVSQICDILGL